MTVLASVGVGSEHLRSNTEIPTELPLGPDDGMPTDGAATFDNVRVIPKSHLVERICVLSGPRMLEACRALRTAFDC